MLKPQNKVTWGTKYSGRAFKKGGQVTETYRLVPENGGTQVRQTVDFSRSGIPFMIQLIMKTIHSLGYPVGRGPLGGIKELAGGSGGHRVPPDRPPRR